ncbi:MAG TPA: DUF1206 domain-containing protein [Pseudonocardiaceae bacterium]|nr:DUF1206 domain-containing protein [Pseudonocardiaceae bacterium]
MAVDAEGVGGHRRRSEVGIVMWSTRIRPDVADRLENNTVVQWLGRFGDVCYGVVHVVVAILALRLAFGGSGSELDQRGAITAIAAAPLGVVLLWLIAVGLFAFGAWQVLAAMVSFRWVRDKPKRTRRRIGAAMRAVAVLAIAVLALRLLLADPTRSESSEQRDWTARLLAVPGGRIVVVVAGLAVVAGAVMMGYRGVKQAFLDDLDLRRTRRGMRTAVGWLGTCGFLAKSAAFAIVGVLVVIAGVRLDPARSGGLDAALHTLAGQPYGAVLLVIVALGLLCYGGYLAAEARYRRS